jgi:NAD(P)-dependent dehydrogenase (short-subunit alcohol dehydrogenase family)
LQRARAGGAVAAGGGSAIIVAGSPAAALATSGAAPRPGGGGAPAPAARRAYPSRNQTSVSTMPLPPASAAPAIDLTGRAILITGASGGLGRPLALACAACGATVVLHGRVVRKLEAVYDEIVGAGHPEPTILPLDLAAAGTAEFDQVTAALRAQLGRLDGLVHTAAFLGSLGPVEHQSFDAWLKVLRIDVAAALGLTRAVMPLLDAAPDAAVIFTLDSRGEEPRAYWGAYAAAKAAVSAFASVLADEWEGRAHLRVNAVVPGPIRSPLRTLTHPGEDKTLLPAPEALVPLYLWLLGAQAKAESGMRVDAAAWLAGQPAAVPLVSPSGAATRP